MITTIDELEKALKAEMYAAMMRRDKVPYTNKPLFKISDSYLKPAKEGDIRPLDRRGSE